MHGNGLIMEKSKFRGYDGTWKKNMALRSTPAAYSCRDNEMDYL
jgi:hypothetical protein